MSIVVTGANGFIGSHSVKRLLESYKVKALDVKFNNPIFSRPNNNLTCYQKDIVTDDLSVIEQGDKVLHLAAVSTFADAEANWQNALTVNVIGTLRVIEACRNKAERLVFSSTGSVYDMNGPMPITEEHPRAPRNIYGLSKKFAEDLIMMSKVPYVILRYGYVYGPGKTHGAIGAFVQKLANGDTPIIYGGNQMNDFTYVKDIVSANIRALETSALNETFNIGTGVAFSVLETYEFVKSLMKSNTKPNIQPVRNSIDFPVFVYNVEKAKHVLKWEAEFNLFEGIKDMLKEMKLCE